MMGDSVRDLYLVKKEIAEKDEIISRLLEALKDLVNIAERDDIGDPDFLPSDEYRIRALKAGQQAIAEVEG